MLAAGAEGRLLGIGTLAVGSGGSAGIGGSGWMVGSALNW